MWLNTTHEGDALAVLKTFPDKAVHCIVTSPPYYKQRRYGHPNELGHEATPESYIERLCDIFEESKRVLVDEGTLWVVIGDSFWGSGKQGQMHMYSDKKVRPSINKEKQGLTTKGKHSEIKPKDLIGIPWMMAFELRKRGWWLRQDNIWHKTNAMPEPVKDRTSRNHEYVFMFSKSYKYYYDADSIKTSLKPSSVARYSQDIENQKGSNRPETKANGPIKAERKINKQDGHGRRYEGFNERWNNMTKEEQDKLGANKRTVWSIGTVALKDDHYAAYPMALIQPCILAGCPVGGIVLDMFHGSGNTGLAAILSNRKFVGIDIVNKNVKMAHRRINNSVGLLL